MLSLLGPGIAKTSPWQLILLCCCFGILTGSTGCWLTHNSDPVQVKKINSGAYWQPVSLAQAFCSKFASIIANSVA